VIGSDGIPSFDRLRYRRRERVSEQTPERCCPETVHTRGRMPQHLYEIGPNQIAVCCGLSREKIPELNYSASERHLGELLEEAGRHFIKI
jgi:hypothetical protein